MSEMEKQLSSQIPVIEEAKDAALANISGMKDDVLQNIAEKEQEAVSNFNAQRVTPEMLSESTKQLINTAGGGTVNNLPDDEDLTTTGGDMPVLKLADRAYNPSNFSGKGYRILRRNIVDGKNVLTQEMVSQPDTVYEIRYDFDLNGAQITIPENCILKFDGGSLNNGKVFSDNKTTRIINPPKIEKGLNDEIYWGVFYDQSNKELTYKFEPFNRPFEIIAQVATTRAEVENGNELRQARNIGINKYNFFIAYHWRNNNWEKGDSTIEGLIELHSKYNIIAYNVRFEANVRQTEDDLDNVVNLMDYINKVKNDIDLIRENNIIVENVFISNEQPKEYQNTKWTSAFIELSSYIKSLGYKSGISHWTSLSTVDDKNSGATSDYNSANFDIFGINHYPKFATDNISNMKVIIDENRIIEVTNNFRTQLNGLIDRGYTKFTLTETGFSEYDRGMSSVDNRTPPLDTTFYIYGSAWKNWLNILKSYRSVIESIDIWKTPTDENNIKSMYNLLLNV